MSSLSPFHPDGDIERDRSSAAPETSASVGPERSAGGGRLIGGRYQLLNELGRGGAGTAYRALDRLTGRVVTIKRLNAAGDLGVSGRLSQSHGRLALAQEFRLLAAIHHPNVVSVLDYGFDAEQRPFFSMDLQENAQTIVDAGRTTPVVMRAELLVQLLRALVYLHRHGIIHRDLKPENVLVVGNHVKVLDFGLSIYRDLLGGEEGACVGTLSYIAPEIFRGEAPSELSDLYGVGVVAFELFSGRQVPAERGRPFETHRRLAALLDGHDSDVDVRVRPILARLLNAEPTARYADAAEVIDALASALGQPFPAETVATRESFLQAAPFVGRDEELRTLGNLLRAARSGQGSTCLIGGESGVGKSRLLEELRTRALVDGCVVTRGQAVSEGGSPYHLWREVVSALALQVDLTDQEAAVLKGLVPDVSRLLGRNIPDPPPLDPAAAQSRLILQVEQLLRAQPGPVLVLLEDLQWAGSESLKLLAAVARVTGGLSVCVVGTFRSDEAPGLGAAVEGASVVVLKRLDADAIARLGGMMIGPEGARPEVAAFLALESEGIPLFIVEVVRALAETAGTLAGIGRDTLSERFVAGGMRRVLQRRLNRVPRAAMPALQTAAVVGREIDPALLRAVHGDAGVDTWLDQCADAAVFEVQEQSWRFAHDKLREQVLADLSPGERSTLHRRVAVAIERIYPADADRTTALAYHWRVAGDPERELHYVERSANQALHSGAYDEASARFARALELVERTAEPMPRDRKRRVWPALDPVAHVTADAVQLRRGGLEAGWTEACYQLGDLTGCELHADRALRAFGLPIPRGRPRWVATTLSDAMLRTTQILWSPRRDTATEVAATISAVQAMLTEVYFYSLRGVPVAWSTLRHLNVAEPSGPSADLARAYTHLGVVAGAMSLTRLATRWSRHAIDVATATGSGRDVAYALTRGAAFELGDCQWEVAREHITRAQEIAAEVGDLRLGEEARTEAGILALYHGPIEPGLASLRAAYELSRRSGSKQGTCWSLMGQGDILVRLGRAAEALPLYEEAAHRLDDRTMLTEVIWAYGGLGLVHLRRGDLDEALRCARRALSCISSRSAVAYWTQQGTAATAEVLVTLHEGRPDTELNHLAAAACRGMRTYAGRFRLGHAHALLWEGVRSWNRHRHRLAMRQWRRAVQVGQALGLPYEVGRAQLEIGRHLPAADCTRSTFLEQACAAFEQLGCTAERDRARGELA